MAKNKDPAVLFYTSDFLGGAALMNMKARGQYITLLCLQRERGHMTEGEVARAVGRLSEEVRGKFETDEDGKLFNRRMEEEIKKREAHSQRQRENVAKRWNKQKDDDGMSSGNTMVLPLGNGTSSSYIDNLSLEQETSSARTREAIATVMSAYLDKINANPSQQSLDELKGYVEQMGPECCQRAFDIALDEKKTSWSYIRAILRNKLAQGVRCLADWDAVEDKRKGEGEDDYWAK